MTDAQSGAEATSENNDRRIDYIELTAPDLDTVKTFYRNAFGWEFTDYGPEYTSFADGRLSGGFSVGEPQTGTVLIVIYATDLEDTEGRIKEAGGQITRPPFDFPGGRRFHFTDPAGNELAVWSDR
jgi:predicted enzyme related to lactoylglutathione lyase